VKFREIASAHCVNGSDRGTGATKSQGAKGRSGEVTFSGSGLEGKDTGLG